MCDFASIGKINCIIDIATSLVDFMVLHNIMNDMYIYF